MKTEQNTYQRELINWQKLIQIFSAKQRHKVAEKRNKYSVYPLNKYPQYPSELILRDYQNQAVINWMKNQGRGTLKMATGSGKTITALAIATELYQYINLEVLLVICPYRHLVLQWEKEAKI